MKCLLKLPKYTQYIPHVIVTLLYNNFVSFIKMTLPKNDTYILFIYFKTFKQNCLISFKSFIFLSFPSPKQIPLNSIYLGFTHSIQFYYLTKLPIHLYFISIHSFYKLLKPLEIIYHFLFNSIPLLSIYSKSFFYFFFFFFLILFYKLSNIV